MSSSFVAKKNMREKETFQRIKPRATEVNTLGAYFLGTEEGSNQEMFLILRGQGSGRHS